MPERPMLAYVVPLDPRRCHCGGWLVSGTDGNGRAMQWCDQCQAESCIVRFPAAWFSEPSIQAASTADLKVCPCGRGPVKSASSRVCFDCEKDTNRASARVRKALGKARKVAAARGPRRVGRAA